MAVLLNGGFEDDAAWLFGGHGGYSTARVHTGARSGILSSRKNIAGNFSSRIDQQIATTPDELIAVSGWLNRDAGSGANADGVSFFVDTNPGDGSNLVQIDDAFPGSFPQDVWSPQIWAPFTAEIDQVYLSWFLPVPFTTSTGSWWLDDFAVAGAEDVVKRSRWLAHQRLITVLKGINGAAGGYHTDLGNRVFTRLLIPGPNVGQRMPYVCVPIAGDQPQILDHDTYFKLSWNVTVVGFLQDPNVGATDSDAIAAGYYLQEDIWRACLLDPTLAGTVNELRLPNMAGGVIAGVDQTPFGEVHVPIELSLLLAADVLGV
jgi:hypothetical protein